MMNIRFLIFVLVVNAFSLGSLSAIQFKGAVKEGETYEKEIGDGLVFQLKENKNKDEAFRHEKRGWSFAVTFSKDMHLAGDCSFVKNVNDADILPQEFASNTEAPESPKVKEMPFMIRWQSVKENGILKINDVTLSNDGGESRIIQMKFAVKIDKAPAEAAVRYSSFTFAGTLNAGEKFSQNFSKNASFGLVPVDDGWIMQITGMRCLPLHGCNNCYITPNCTIYLGDPTGKDFHLPVTWSVDLELGEPAFSTSQADQTWRYPYFDDMHGVLFFTIKDLKMEDTGKKEFKGTPINRFSKMIFDGVLKIPYNKK